MKIACISDVHGNLPAFEAVANDICQEKPDMVVFLGDLVFCGLYPRECYEMLLSLHPSCCIKGNTDANLEEITSFKPSTDLEKKLYENMAYCDQQLTEQAKADIASWPIAQRIVLEGEEIIACHGSPYHSKDHLALGSNQLKLLSCKIEKEKVGHIFCGHTHIPQTFMLGNTTIVNAGAIGYSFDGDKRPSYCLATFGREIETIQIKRLGYASEGYKKKVLGSPLFGHDLWYILEHGTYEKRA
ncbi:metallophosphoesterase family protein [uncultured Sphaerochaeta sp.]|uniref:metallophosphoesterase family protein n=1 Tax=uncultured Sphaerochaeta sp. TaxID=886478 RepID=UPI002A0A5227|nr:metallophosphoesterase family protein [uncultured Sphaerochaeta sp.]